MPTRCTSASRTPSFACTDPRHHSAATCGSYHTTGSDPFPCHARKHASPLIPGDKRMGLPRVPAKRSGLSILEGFTETASECSPRLQAQGSAHEWTRPIPDDQGIDLRQGRIDLERRSASMSWSPHIEHDTDASTHYTQAGSWHRDWPRRHPRHQAHSRKSFTNIPSLPWPLRQSP